MIQVAGRDSFEVRTDTAQFGSHKTVHEVQAAIQPGKELILDVIVNRERNFGAIWPNLSEINDPHQCDISAHGLEGVLVRRFALDRQQDCVGFKAQGPSEAEIDRLGRSHSGPCDHQKLPPVRLNAGQTSFALFHGLAHV